MKSEYRKALVLFLLVLVFFVVGCNVGADCMDDCEDDDECGSGLICGSSGCIPDECEKCFNVGDYCSFDKTFNTNTESYDCDFSYCQ